MLSEQASNDKRALSLAEAVALASERARAAGVPDERMRLFVEEDTQEDGIPFWRINFAPMSPPGTFPRGGDYTVEVNADDGTVRRALRGQ